jgi:hypothetical protein
MKTLRFAAVQKRHNSTKIRLLGNTRGCHLSHIHQVNGVKLAYFCINWLVAAAFTVAGPCSRGSRTVRHATRARFAPGNPGRVAGCLPDEAPG